MRFVKMPKKPLKTYSRLRCRYPLLVGGTITNQTIIKACLKPFEAVIACDTGHIATHETGAIEAVGHKVIQVNNYAGKINPSDIRKVFDAHMLSYEHMVYPKMVYISNATEYGTVYTLDELKTFVRFAMN